jgi:hypothetical protein
MISIKELSGVDHAIIEKIAKAADKIQASAFYLAAMDRELNNSEEADKSAIRNALRCARLSANEMKAAVQYVIHTSENGALPTADVKNIASADIILFSKCAARISGKVQRRP